MEAFLVAAGVGAELAPALSTAFTVASTAFQVVGALSQAGTASANYKAQAQASEYNAAVARNAAETARQESTAAQLAQRRKAAQILGTQRAAIAESGTGFGGTNADLYERSSSLAELDALNLAYEGEVKAAGYMAQSELDDHYANVARVNARSATTSGYFAAGTALATGLSKLPARRPSVLTSGYSGPTTGGLGIKGLRLSGSY